VLLFKDYHIAMILAGEKWQTRRSWKKARAKIGAIHLAKVKMLSREYFARLLILAVYEERLGDISEEDARAEGYQTKYDYLVAFQKINHISDDDFTDMLKMIVYVVKFKAVE
jgi:hypothetical protein